MSETIVGTIAQIAAGLLGIGLAVVAILPIAFDMLAQQRSKLALRLSVRRLRFYFVLVTMATLVFALSVTAALLALATHWWPLSIFSLCSCLLGISMLAAACGGVFVELVPALKR